MTRTEMIHKEFRSALDSSILVIEEPKIQVTEDAHLLDTIGAHSSKNAKRLQEQVSKIATIKSKNEITKQLLQIEAAFPQYRIIDINSVYKLMKKYNLCLGLLSDYTEEIPLENQKNIAQYVNLVEDLPYKSKLSNILNINLTTHIHRILNSIWKGKTGLLIVAPKQFFANDLKEIDRFMCNIEKPKISFEVKTPSFETDPIVLNILKIENAPSKYAHIVDAWDVEANDPAVSKNIPIVSTNN